MDTREFSELCSIHENSEIEFTVNFMELSVILGSIRLMVDHPEVQAMSFEYHEMVAGIRETILEALRRLGLTHQQVHDMNTLYASESGSVSDRVDLGKIFTVLDGGKKGNQSHEQIEECRSTGEEVQSIDRDSGSED